MANYQLPVAAILCILLLAFIERGSCNCPVYGCTLFHSFTTPTQYFNSSARPRLLWEFVHDQLRPTGAGCVTNGGRVLCPMVVSGQEKAMLISWDTLTNGRSSWNATLQRADLPLPVVDTTGEVIASNGYKLFGFMPDGKPFGKPIVLYPIHGHVMDLSISSGQYLILLYKCGFFVVYLTNGIPHASIWLNDTVDGVKGTFIPLNTPVLNTSSSERLYILTVFRPFKSSQNNSFSQDPYMRLYAIDVTGEMAYRIHMTWYYDFTLPSASIPYTKSQVTNCTIFYPPNSLTPDHKDNSENVTMLPADILVQGDAVLATLNYVDTKSGDSHCLFLAVSNLGKNYSINFSKDTVQHCHGMAYNSEKSTLYAQDSGFPNKQLLVWIHVFDPITEGSSLLLTDMYSGDITKNISLSSLMGKANVNITSRMLIAYLYLGNSTLSDVPPTEQPGTRPVPLIFGITDSSGEGSIIAVDLVDMKVLWTLPIPKGRRVVGQICTVDRLRDSLMVFTDQVGVYFFQIS